MDAEWKKALSLSLRQDLQQIKILIKEMGILVKGHQQVNSWLFPNKPYNSVMEGGNADNYTQCLESVLDSVYIVLNMLIVYINDSASSVSGKMPQRLTLGQSFEVIWIKLRDLVPSGRKRNQNSGNKSVGKSFHFSKSSQTESTTMVGCDGCFISTSCIKKVAHTLDAYADSTTILSRKKVRARIFDNTVFGSMMQMCSSIENDVESLIENNKKLTNENALINTKYNTLIHDYNEMERTRIDKKMFDKFQIEYMDKCAQLEKDLLKSDHEKNKLHTRMMELGSMQEKFVVDLKKITLYTNSMQKKIMVKLQTNDNSLIKIENQIDQYKTQINSHTNKCIFENLLITRSALENYILNIENFEELIKQKLERSSKAVCRVEEMVKTVANAEVKVKYQKLHTLYNKEREKRCKIEMKYYKAVEENKRLGCVKVQNIKELNAYVLKMLDENGTKIICSLDTRLESIKRVQSSLRKYMGDSTMVAVIKGDPIEDMTRQIEANEAKVLLKRENSNLLKTVNKLKLINRVV